MKKKDLEILVDLQEEYIADLEEYNEATLDIISQLQGTRKMLNGDLSIIEYTVPIKKCSNVDKVGVFICILFILIFSVLYSIKYIN